MHTKPLLSLTLLALTCGSGCKSDDDEPTKPGATKSPQCEGDGYVAFDSANHAPQDSRLAAHAEMNARMEAAIAAHADADAAGAAASFEAARALYLDAAASADLRAKVMGRLDQHVDGDPLQGDRLDATITSWLDFGVAAQSALEASVAKQWVDKTLTEFFFLSVHHELLEGARDKWDEALGYYGSGEANDEGDARGLAATAGKRDATNGTNLRASIYNHLIDGACVLDTALAEAGEDSLQVADTPELQEIVVAIDGELQQVLAYSAGHEAFEMAELLEASPVDASEIMIKAAELIPFFLPLQRIMQDGGGASAERAAEIGEILDAMPVRDPATFAPADTTWIDTLGDGPSRIIPLLQAELGIDIKG